jgi:hypothetical protein
MYLLIGIAVAVLAAIGADRANKSDRGNYDTGDHELLLLHIRQDIKLIAFLLFGVIVMLGLNAAVIADQHHSLF